MKYAATRHLVDPLEPGLPPAVLCCRCFRGLGSRSAGALRGGSAMPAKRKRAAKGVPAPSGVATPPRVDEVEVHLASVACAIVVLGLHSLEAEPRRRPNPGRSAQSGRYPCVFHERNTIGHPGWRASEGTQGRNPIYWDSTAGNPTSARWGGGGAIFTKLPDP